MNRLLPALLLLIGTGFVVAQPAVQPAAQPAAGQVVTKSPRGLRPPVVKAVEPPAAPKLVRLLSPAALAKADPNVQLRGLGRVKPAAAFDYDRFRVVQGPDGKTRYFPRLARSADVSRLTATLPPAIDYSKDAANVVSQMYLNDQFGCCVIASRYHQIGFMTAADTGTGLVGTDNEVYSAYVNACGNLGPDNGCSMSAVNEYQQRVGLNVRGVNHKTKGSVSVDHSRKELVKAGIYFFGGMNVGMSLPQTWFESADNTIWGETNSPIVGGHEVQAFGYNDTGVLISTWGGTRTITWSAFTSTRYIEETYVTLSPDWLGSDDLSPHGVNMATLESDLAVIAGGGIPVLPTPPVTPPITPPPGAGFTGTLQYQNGALVAVTQGPVAPGGTTTNGVEADLKAAGVNGTVIADVLKLIADIRTGASLFTIVNDLIKLHQSLERFPRRAPDPNAAPAQNAAPPKCCGQ